MKSRRLRPSGYPGSVPRREKYHQVIEGEWTPIIRRGLKEMCCHCGLVHVVDTRESDGVLEVRRRIDARATAAARRQFNFSKEED
jgi:hypothetical protein